MFQTDCDNPNQSALKGQVGERGNLCERATTTPQVPYCYSVVRNSVEAAGLEPATYGSQSDNDDRAAPRGKLVKVEITLLYRLSYAPS